MTQICQQSRSTHLPVPSAIPLLKGVEIPINYGHGDCPKFHQVNKKRVVTGVGDELRKSRLVRAKIEKSSAFVNAKYKLFSKRNPFLSASQPSLKAESDGIGRDVVDRNEIVTYNDNLEETSRPVSQVRMVYKNTSNKNTSNCNISDKNNCINQSDGPKITESSSVKNSDEAHQTFNKNHTTKRDCLSSSDLYTMYKKDGLQFDTSRWQEHMAERYQLVQDQRKQRHQQAANKRLYMQSERLVAAVEANRQRFNLRDKNFTRSRSSRAYSRLSGHFPPGPVISRCSISSTSSKCSPRVSFSSSLSKSLSQSSFKYRVNHISSVSSSDSLIFEEERNLSPRTRPSSSIPAKMNYVLVETPKQQQMNNLIVVPNKLEQKLMSLRFPARYQEIERSLLAKSKDVSTPQRRPKTAAVPHSNNNSGSKDEQTSYNINKQRSKSARVTTSSNQQQQPLQTPLMSVLHRSKRSYKPVPFH